MCRRSEYEACAYLANPVLAAATTRGTTDSPSPAPRPATRPVVPAHWQPLRQTCADEKSSRRKDRIKAFPVEIVDRDFVSALPQRAGSRSGDGMIEAARVRMRKDHQDLHGARQPIEPEPFSADLGRSTWHGLMPQTWSAYSRIARSELNRPMFAMFMMPMRVHRSKSRYV